MGFFSSIASAVVKTALTPIAVVKDATRVVIGVEPTSTKDLLNSAGKDIEEAVDDLG